MADPGLLVQRKIRLTKRVFFAVVAATLLLFGVAAAVFSGGIGRMEALATAQQENDLRDKVSLALGALSPAIEAFKAGTITRAEALDRIRAIGHTLLYNDEFGKNYIFINQQDGVVLVRPYRAQDEMQNLWLVPDSRGQLTQQIVSRAAEAHPEGSLVSYEFTNPVTGRDEPKLSWVVLVPELGIHVGTGKYLSAAVQGQIHLAREFFWWGLGLLALLLVPFLVLLVFLQRQNTLLTGEMRLLAEKEQALAASEEQFRTLFELVPFGCTLTDPAGRYLRVNTAFNQSLGFRGEEVLGKTLEDLGFRLGPGEPVSVPDLLAQGALHNREETLVTPDGRTLHILYSSRVVNLGGQTGILTATVDITRIRQTEQALRENEQKYRSIFDAAGDAIFVLDQGTFIDCNAQTQEVFGLGREELLGRSILEFSPEIQPGGLPSRTGSQQKMQAVYGGQAQVFEWTHRRADGSTFESEVSLSPILIDGTRFIQAVLRDITARKRSEELMLRMNQELESLVAQRTEALSEAVSNLRASNEELGKTIHHLEDTRHQLVQSEKLAALGSLVVGIAHELNTPLGNAILAASSLQARYDEFDAAHPDKRTPAGLEEALRNGAELAGLLWSSLQKMVDLLGSFKQIAVDQRAEPRKTFRLHKLVQETLMQLPRPKVPPELTLAIPEDLVLESYPEALSQVLLHLGGNALAHAFDGHPEPKMAISAEPDGPDALVLSFSDNGCGMGPEVMKRVFDPFFTTKLGKGRNGLGMHLAFNLVTGVLGGTIRGESAPGQGTTWRLRLPRKG